MKQAICCERLYKEYGEGKKVVRALNGIDLSIESGRCFGLLGPNGAGKTTTVEILEGLLRPTSGTVRVLGMSWGTGRDQEIRQRIGITLQETRFQEKLSCIEILTLFRSFYRRGIEPAEALGMVSLEEKSNAWVRELSGGQKQRLAIADVLVKMPKVAILDEPTAGIDPEGTKEMLELIARIAREQNMTIILSSHQLQQVQQICSRVGILAKGRMVAEGPLDQLGREALSGGRFIVEVQLAETTGDIINRIKQIKRVGDVERSGDLLLISCLEDLRPQISKAIVEANGLLVQMRIQSYALEDIYLRYFRGA